MSDPKGGSANNPPSTPPATSPGEKTTAKIAKDELLVEIDTLKQNLSAAELTIADLTAQLKEANDVLEDQTKAKLISEILPRSKFTVEDLKDKPIEELQNIRATLDQAKLPTYKNIHMGPIAADEPQAPNLTVGSKFAFDKKKEKS